MDSYINFNCIIRKRNLFAHIFIWTNVSILLIMSTTVFNGNLIGIIYLLFFLSFVLLYQTYYSLWARCIRPYCIVLSLYSVIVSLLTYSYQYTSVSTFFKSILTEPILNDLGFVAQNQAYMVFLEPFLPLLLAILSVLYLKIFREDFNRFAYLAEDDDMSLSTPLTESQINLPQNTINNSTVIMLHTTSNDNSTSHNQQHQQATTAAGGTGLRQHQQQDGQQAKNLSLVTQNNNNNNNSNNNNNINSSKLDLRRASKLARFEKFCSSVSDCLLRLLEAHFVKLVAFMIFRLPIIDLCLMNFPFLFIVIFMLKYPSTARCSTLIASWLISFVIILRQLSKLSTLRVYDLTQTCPTTANVPTSLAGNTYSFLTYLGINHDLDNPLNRVDNHIYVLLLITAYSFTTIHFRNKNYRSKNYESIFNIIFPHIGRREADQSLWNLVKYFCNFGFFKFGIELNALALIIAISNRLDVIASIHGIMLTLLCITVSKRTLASIWPVLTIIVSLLIPIQFLLRLGIPQAFCQQYPWSSMPADFKYWLFLPDYSAPQDVNLLLYDFLVLLFVCRQAVVFNLMSITSGNAFIINNQIHHNFSAHQFKMKYLPDEEEFAAEDCFSNYTTPSNYLKSIFFISTYWITLAVVLIAGATKISLFSLGYLIGCFIFLWLGNDTYLMPLKGLIFRWNCFIFYAALVIFTKVILQLYSCYEHTYLLNHCYILQLLRIVCYRKVQHLPLPPVTDPAAMCAASLPYDELDILWDGLCLMFLLMQRVVFGSQYFRYLVQEVKAQQILASRGAELIMATQIEEAKAQALYEKEVMRNIRAKMEDLKTDNQETSKAWERLLSLPHHHQIIRNADKHLFSLHEDTLHRCRTDDWKFKKAFIPDPLGDELERMGDINGITAVFTRWMKGEPLYGGNGGGGGCSGSVQQRSPQRKHSTESATGDSRPHPPDFVGVASTSGGGAELLSSDYQESDQQIEVGMHEQQSFVQEHRQQQQQESCTTSTTIDSRGQEEQTLTLAPAESYDIIPDDDDSSDGERMRGWWEVLNLLVYSILLSATVELNKLSRSYRYVSRRMAVEKTALKKHFNLNDERFKRDPGWRKWVISTLSDTYARTTSEYNQQEQSNTSLYRIRSALRAITGSVSGNNGHTSSQDSQHSMGGNESPRSPPQEQQQQKQQQYGSSPSTTKTGELTDPEYHFLKLNMFTQFCRALAYVFISNTSLLCQLVIVFNQVITASLLSLPLPLLTFLWGTLSVPRPTKRFWKIVITYTELVIVVKSMLKSLGQWDASGGGEDQYLLVDVSQSTNVERQRRWTPASVSMPAPVMSMAASNSSNTLRQVKSSGELTATTQSIASHGQRSSETGLRSRFSNSIDTPAASVSAPDQYIENPYQNQEITMASRDDDDAGGDGGAQKTGLQSKNCIVQAYIKTRKSILLFFQHALNTPYKVQTDVYTWCFLCDFINFLILIYGFWAFGSGYTNQTVASFLNENRIPFSVLIIVLAQFASIIVDRAFYLQKNIAGKLVFQVILVIGIHIWIFFALPFTTGHALTLKQYWPPKAWYVFKCIYFLLSAHQIRSGYPRRVLGNCLTKGYGYANWGAFKVYRAIPLVYDLRLYMDWIWTETTLEFRNWSLMEDMFANLFIRKCELTLEEEYPIPRAKPIKHLSKYLTGGAYILLILAIIWGPLLLFSMGKTVGESNPPAELEYELEIVGFQPILRMRATAQQINMLSAPQYDQMKAKFVSLTSQSFLGDYKVGDVAAIQLDGQSNAVWEISPPSKSLLMNRIKNNETITLKSSWTVFRIKKQKSQSFDASIAGSYQQVITGNSSQEFRSSLYDMLANSSTTLTNVTNIKSVVTPAIFPNYIRVPETGQANVVEQFYDNLFEYQALRPLSLSYIRMFDLNVNQTDNSTSWWKAEDLCKYNPINDSFPFWSEPFATGKEVLEHCDSLLIVSFNDRIFTGILALLSAPGIIGLYTTFVVFFARLIRTEPSGKVIYTEIPNVNRVYGLIMDIYMARECGEFELEEKLFAKLLFLYRSPEMLIDFSKREDEPQPALLDLDGSR